MKDPLEKLLRGIDLSLIPSNGTGSTAEEAIPEEIEIVEEPKVFLQKLVTEVWIYTDLDKKTVGSASIQDIVILGEMDQSAAMKLIQDRRNRKKKSS